MELPEVGTNERSVLICPTGRTACQPHPGPDTADADVVARMAAAFAVVLADIRGSLERWGDDIDSAVVARGQFCIASAFVGLRRGDRLAQGIVLPCPRVEWEEVAEMSVPTRGGFGSTGS